MFDYDAEMQFYRERFRAACAVRAGERVLDVGCGGGQTTRDAGRDAAPGRVLGVDVSERMLEQARRRTSEDGNIDYLLADASAHDFSTTYDVGISRFGVMFFADPAAAFANLRRACRRIVLMVWQSRAENQWAQVIPAALGGAFRDDSPFSLGDREYTRKLLTSAGFSEPTFTAVREPIYYGPDVQTAYENVLQLHEPKALLAELDPAAANRGRASLRDVLAAHDTGNGILFDSAVWIVEAE
ncbi:class I SAM-dependent methyltransferase [Kribbella sp.]|uniref:class I SAM-dependent methyltransferase n=1 Tax=Kribbella sp. TaxID=1871183 RepID=UPI002D647115|nr:class I SAM-dependent methyltransferase [Kribbella sp.]HZX06101.1 class I SAM-dependent methyltransferase [Kribbella sp.]